MLERTEPLMADFSRILDRIIGILPEVLAALAILLIGWLIAATLRALTIRSAGMVNRMIGAIGVRFRARTTGIRETSARVVGGIVFWLVMLFFLTSATNVVGLEMFSGWLDRLVAYLPKILSGVLIIFAGVILANIARDSVLAAFAGLNESQRTYLARAAQVSTLSVLVIVGVDQVGIDITVVVTVLAVVLGSVLGGLSIAFSLGARSYVSNLIGAHYINKDYREGERIRIRDLEGRILEITPVSVILETQNGRLSVPARLFTEEAVLLIAGEDRHG